MENNLSEFEKIKHINENGIEFWYARELMSVLGYKTWESFNKTILRAMISLDTTKMDTSEHFREVTKTSKMPNNATKNILDYQLTRYACYLAVQNGDPRKKEIALGQQYFALQTRKQELLENDLKYLTEDEKRLLVRESVTTENKKLFNSAQKSGVKNFGKFNNAGYSGLYNGETAEDIKRRKKLSKKENILDYMGSTELAANLFRITQTDERLKQGDINTEKEANQKHYDIGKKVRETMIEISNTKPEELPTPEKSVKEIEKENRKVLKDISKNKKR